jgi:hypothetical protein
MPDDAPPPLTSGDPRFAWFDGIVEGRLGDAAAVRDAVARANRAGYVRMNVGVDGGRFSVLMDDATIPASRMTDANRGALANALHEIATASAGPIESTLRCTEVFRDEVRETVFLPDAGGIRAVTRTRPVADADLHRNPEVAPPTSASMGRGRLAIVGVLLLVAFGLAAWTSGWVDRLLSAKAEAIVIEAGPFAGFVQVESEKAWGDYRVTLRRGAAFPVSNEAVAAARAKASTPAERAAVEIVANGGELWIRLEDAAGHVLHAERAELRPLVAGAEREVEARLPGRITAARVRLDVDAGVEFK